MGALLRPRFSCLRSEVILTLVVLLLACLATRAVGQSQGSGLNSTDTSANASGDAFPPSSNDTGLLNNETQTVDPSGDGTLPDYTDGTTEPDGNPTDEFTSGNDPTDNFSDVSGTDAEEWLKRDWLNQDGNFTEGDGSSPLDSLPDYAEMNGGKNADWLGPPDDDFYEEQAEWADSELDTLLTPVAACQPSKLTGFNNSVDLNGKGLLLHWTHVSPQLMNMAVEARPGSGADTAGWIAVGWSLEGHMVPADAIVGGAAIPSSALQGGLPSESVLPFYITGYEVSSLERTNGLNYDERAWNWTKAKDGSVIMRFTRREELDGFMPIKALGVNHMIWAYAQNGSRQLAYHGGNKGALRVDYSCATPSVARYRSKLACQRSTLPGYSCMLQLQREKFVLHWHRRNTSILLAADVATTGWVGLGWSKDGKMAESEAAIGNLPRGSIVTGAAVGSYGIKGYEKADVAPTGQFEVFNDAVGTASNGRTVMRFERGVLPNQMPFSGNEVATIIWAYSQDNSQELAFHGDNMGSATIDFSTGRSASPSSSSSALVAHAVFLSVAFFLLMPSAIIIARLFLTAPSSLSSNPLHLSDANSTDSHPSSSSFSSSSAAQIDNSILDDSRRKFWFAWHKYLQVAAIVCICAGCITAFVTSGSHGFQYTHAWIGIFILLLLVALQPLLVYFRPTSRPSASDSSDSAGQWHHTSWTRGRWRMLHWLVGVVGVALGWINCFLGLALYSNKFATGVVGGYAVFALLVAVIASIYVALVMRDVKRKKAASAAAAESIGFQMQSRAVV
ncbi:hypothetical protein CLOM_g4394 [Closterium sp. NIES-68]|nr:hypothetical protein CLOM_g4394 [Closterium sp. NIES-68]GJP86956.1 hypothetical protein CLOP_g16916 [Closterium sp. NIES-67]